MPAKNLDLLKVTFLKIEDNLLSSLFWDVKPNKVISFYLSILAGLKFFLLLSEGISKELKVLL